MATFISGIVGAIYSRRITQGNKGIHTEQYSILGIDGEMVEVSMVS